MNHTPEIGGDTMRTRAVLATSLLFAGVMTATAVAEGKGATTPQSPPHNVKGVKKATPAASKVPQAQIDTVKKREAALKRRDQLLKERAKNAQGN
jgi:hypothetical protein